MSKIHIYIYFFLVSIYDTYLLFLLNENGKMYVCIYIFTYESAHKKLLTHLIECYVTWPYYELCWRLEPSFKNSKFSVLPEQQFFSRRSYDREQEEEISEIPVKRILITPDRI